MEAADVRTGCFVSNGFAGSKESSILRREKATSNVCTAQALLAVMASMYAVFHGPEGLKAIAQRIHRKTVRLANGLEAAGFKVDPKAFFDTITVDVGPLQAAVMKSAVDEGINLRRVGETRVGITMDERCRPETIEAVWRAFGIVKEDKVFNPDYRFPEEMLRTTEYLTHPIFHMNRAETEMMRYMRRLADRDLALDRAMIPLGSCTMKLNSAAEMMPVSWREFSLLHPFAPADQALGYKEMIDDLSAKLCDITGYDAISMQPNSGAQGEYAGLLTIAAYHRAQGQGHRNICLIPMSAHGTNPASAQMVGLEGRGDQIGGQWRYRSGGFPRQGRAARRKPRRLHDHLSVDPRGFRRDRDGSDPDRACAWRTGLYRRGEHERDGWAVATWRSGRGCEPSQPAQDLLHSAWGWRSRYGPDRCQGASGAAFAGSRDDWRSRRAGISGTLRVAIAVADQLVLLSDDGGRGAHSGDAGGDLERELHRQTARRGLRCALQGTDGSGRA